MRQQSSFHQAKFAQRTFLPQCHLLIPDGRQVSLVATRYSGAAATISLQERGVVSGKAHKFGFPWAEARKSGTSSLSSGPPRPWMVERHLQETEDRKAEQLQGSCVHLSRCYRAIYLALCELIVLMLQNQPQNCPDDRSLLSLTHYARTGNSLRQQPEGLSARRKHGW